MPPHYLKAIEKETGRPCPRVEWPTPDGPLLMDLVRLGSRNEASGHFFREVFHAHFGDEPAGERQRALRMVMRAYGDDWIRAALFPERATK